MATTLETFRSLIGEYTSVSDATVEAYLNSAALQLEPLSWGDMLTLGLVYHAAHEMKMLGVQEDGTYSGEETDAAGPATSKRAGDVAVSYGKGGKPSGDQSVEWYRSTRYGQKFLQLRGSRVASHAHLVDVNG